MTVEKTSPNSHSDGNLAATYALIYSFLTARSHGKAASAVRKAARDIIVLKDDIEPDDIALCEIVKWWKLKKEADAKHDSGSGSDSNSDTSSSNSESTTESSSDDSLDSDSSSNPSNDFSIPPEPEAATLGSSASKLDKSFIRGSDVVPLRNTDSKMVNQQTDTPKKPKDRTKSKGAKYHSSSVVSVCGSDSADVRAIKKRRISESGSVAVAALIVKHTKPSPAHTPNDKSNGKKPRKSNTPFQRIKADGVEFYDERLKDNAFIAKGGTTNDYGARANEDLIVTRGDGFRKEKNKKKRGSYRGGEITLESHSIKFT